MKKVNLNSYNNSWYKPAGKFKKTLWYFTNIFFFKTFLPFPSNFKVKVLKLFGSKVGKGVVLKPSINIKYPWFLEIGNFVWIGEEVWIDNLAKITIGNNCTISQGAYLLTGSHNYKSENFDLIIKEIILEEGAWVGAKSIVCLGVTLKSHSVLSVGSTATKDLEPYFIYQGNPAIKKRGRLIE